VKGSKKYKSYEYAAVNEYLPKALQNDVTNGETTKKPRFSKKPAVSSEKGNKKIRSTKIDHPYETGD